MKKFINLVALAALLFVPSIAQAQTNDCTDYASIPYSTGFEGISTGGLPSCWVQYQTSAGYDGVNFPCAYNYSGNARNGNVYFEFETHSGQNEIVAMPLMENINTLKLTFWASAQSSYLPVRFEVGVMEESSTDTVFVPVDTITFTTSSSWGSGYNQYTVYFSNYTGSGERIAFRATGSGSGQYTLMMDDFNVSDALVPEVSLPASVSTNINTDLTITAMVNGPTDGISYIWSSNMADDGDATMSFIDNVLSINYSTAGFDTITVTVSNSNGSNTATMAVHVMDLSPITEYPYSTGFEATDDANWNFVNETNGWFIGSAANNGGSNALYISNDNGVTNSYNVGSTSTSYAYRYFQLDAGEYAYSFDWRCVGEGSSYATYDYLRFYLGSTDADFSGSSVSTTGWTDLCGNLLSQSSWQNQSGVFTVTTSGLYPIVFYWHNDYTAGTQPPAGIDNFMITPLTCPAVSSITLDSAEQESLTFHWHPLGEETSWEVTVGDEEPVTVSDTTYTVQSLNSNTAYVVSVRAVCGANDTSLATTATFRTSCGSLSIPFMDDFDNYANGDWPPCWHRVRAYGTDPSVNNQFHHSGSQSMFLLASNDTTLFVTPSTIPLNGNEIQVRYYAFLNYASYYNETKWIKGGVMTDTSDISTFISLDSVGYHNFNYEFEEREFNTANLDPNAEYWVAWMFYSTNNGYGYYNRGAIDDVSITQLSSCVRPATAQIGTVGARQANVSWSSVAGSNNYTVYYYTSNDPTNNNVLSESVSGDTTVTLTGLQPETQYYVWVATNCGGDESDLRPAGSFTTLISCPTVTGLTVDTTTADGATISWNAGDVETQWVVVLDSNDAEIVSDSVYTVSGLDAMTGHTLYVRALCDTEDTSAVSSISFATSCADATCLISAYVTDSYNDSWNGGYINIVQAGIAVGTIECPSGQSGITLTYEVCSTAPVTLVLGNLGSWPGEMGGTISDGGGNVVFTIQSMNSYSNGATLATVATPCPECIMPMHLTVDTVSATEATITWDRGEGSSWIVRMDSTDQFVSDTFYTFNSLNPSTAYTVLVATDCGGDTSSFASISFTTACAGGSCDITVDMTDSYGDGWNGAGINFYQNGALAGTASLSGSTDIATVSVCSGIPVTFSWHSGSYDYECSYIIYDGASTEVYNSANSGVDHSDSIVNACPTCLTPTGVTATAIDSNSITFSWTEDPEVLEYRISFNGDVYTTGFNGSETYTNLTANTAYTFSVIAVCAPGDTSAARTITVKTTCGQMALPFVESFEADAVGSVPSCWNVVSGTPAIENIIANTGTNHIGLYSGDMIATSLVPLNGDSIHVSFWANFYSGTLEAGVMTNPAADTTFIPLMTITGTNNYEMYEFNTLTLDHFTNYYVAFRYNASYYPARIDDINIRLDDGCMHPANLTANPTAINVELAWSYSGTLPTFAIQYHAAGDTAWTSDNNIIDTLATLTGLASATTYEVRVGAICGNDTLWSTVSFQTPCGILPIPYAEDFDAYPNDVLPPCWTYNSSAITHWDGGVFFRSNYGGGSYYAVLPQLDGNITKLKIEFDTKVGTIAEQDGILIGVADASGSLLAWLDTIQDVNFSRNQHVRKTVYLTSYQLPSGAARIAFAQYRNWNEWALIDNINIEELPDCYPVSNVTGYNLDDPEATMFTWHPLGYEGAWQVYVDTVTVDIDSLYTMPLTNFIDVTDTFYTIPIGMIQGGGIYNFFVRANCGNDLSDWVKAEFGAGTIIMDNNTVADTVEGCGFVVYDNGGPVAGYLANSNSTLVLRTENAGSQLEVFGGKFGFGMSPATLTVYDGEGTTGDVLYTYNTVDGRDTLLNTILATSTTGSLTITFVSSGTLCHTGYELYIRCTAGAVCPRPTQLQATMTSASTATATWDGTASNYNFYYRLAGSTAWTRQNVNADSINLTGLVADTVYDMYVVALCTATDSSTASVTRQLYTHYDTPIVYFNVTVGSADATMGSASADHTGEVEEGTTVTAIATPFNGYRFVAWMSNGSQVSTDNPYTFTVTADITLDATFEQIEGIDDVANNHIALYPNPASTTVTITGIEGQATVTVVDMNGRVVITTQLLSNSVTLSLADLAQGAYFVRIVSEQSTTIRKLIVR